MELQKKRGYKMDNVRLILIFLVLFGHMLELFPGDFRVKLYRVIYSFHMPAFMFLTGYFGRFRRGKILKSLILPYVVFQTIYLYFDALVIQGVDMVTLQYTTPHWLLWYLLAAAFSYLLIPFIDTENKKLWIVTVLAAFLLSFLAGFDKTVGYYFTLSRFFVFFPYFVMGFYASKVKLAERITENRSRAAVLAAVSAALAAAGSVFAIRSGFENFMLYGSVNYVQAKGDAADRVILALTAISWIALLLICVPNVKIPFVTVLGQNTLTIFLMHGFFIKLFSKYGVFKYSQKKNILLAAALSAAMVCIFGNSLIPKAKNALKRAVLRK